ncbi:MAG TPA: glycosyltransferase family A protein [Terriglobales bacterium]|nr:glycosyltransferase family A protein [Terriglobales bacterium]
MPRFSIVIPTRNRAHLLAYALESALRQTAGDFEIVVSDNASTDETEAVATKVASPRVRYVRSEQSLSMPDSWEFALAHARGEYVTYLCDDDAIAPGTLSTVERVLQRTRAKVAMWGGATYYHETWPEAERRNTVVVPTFTGRILEIASRSKLGEIYGLRLGRTPMLVNSVCHVSIVETVARKAGRFFVGYSPDFAAGIAMLAHVPSFVFVDTILSVGGATPVSTGMVVRQSRGEVFQRTLQELGDQANLHRVPLRIHVQTAHLSEHFLLLKETFSAELRDYEIDWIQFFVNTSRELDIYARNGWDVSSDRTAWRDALAAQPAPVQASVSQRLAQTVDEDRAEEVQPVALTPLGIHDIVECARYLEGSRRTLKGIAKSTLVRILGDRWGLDLASSLSGLVRRARRRVR